LWISENGGLGLLLVVVFFFFSCSVFFSSGSSSSSSDELAVAGNSTSSMRKRNIFWCWQCGRGDRELEKEENLVGEETRI
jgi:hypothetical protein